jgi:hypothetical protein
MYKVLSTKYNEPSSFLVEMYFEILYAMFNFQYFINLVSRTSYFSISLVLCTLYLVQ